MSERGVLLVPGDPADAEEDASLVPVTAKCRLCAEGPKSAMLESSVI